MSHDCDFQYPPGALTIPTSAAGWKNVRFFFCATQSKPSRAAATATNCWSNCVRMIYKTHFRDNLSSRWPRGFTASEFQQIKGQKVMSLPAAFVDGAAEPQAAISAYQVDSSSDSTRRLTLTPAAAMLEMWAMVQKNRNANWNIYGLNSKFPSKASQGKNLFHLFIGQVSLMEFAEGNANVWRKRKERESEHDRTFVDEWNRPSAMRLVTEGFSSSARLSVLWADCWCCKISALLRTLWFEEMSKLAP